MTATISQFQSLGGHRSPIHGNTRSPYMTRRTTTAIAAILFLCGVALTLAAQSVFPTGTTIYDPARAWSGYTVLSPLNTQAAIVIDMNGTVVKRWDGFINSAGGPVR